MRTVAHLSDLHFGTAPPATVDALIECLARVAPDVVAVSGDLTQRARTSQFERARAFLDALPGVHIVVPGNHDVPLYNLVARFRAPLRRFHRHITAARHPQFRDDEIAVVGADTTRAFTIKDGGLRPADVRRVADALEQAGPGSVRIVVCHHPFDPPAGPRGRWTAPAADTEAVNTLVARGADVFLTGHLHLTYVGHTAARYRVAGRSAIVVEAGTATSSRARGETNSFNLLRVERDRIVIERFAWQASGGRFAPASADAFVRSGSGWQQETARRP